MKVDVSDITKINGASLKVEFSGAVEGLDSFAGEIDFEEPAGFCGTLVNQGGTLKLEGKLKSAYTVKCYRCLKDVNRKMDLDIKEDILSPESNNGKEAYTYQDNSIDLDRVLKDNIILNLPMKTICSEECRGLCEHCGADLNIAPCGCKDKNEINPSMEALKNYFKQN